MNEPIRQIADLLNSTIHQMFQNRMHVCSSIGSQANFIKDSHKYIIKNNLIVYEKYDRHGRLIAKIPWLPKSVDLKT